MEFLFDKLDELINDEQEESMKLRTMRTSVPFDTKHSHDIGASNGSKHTGALRAAVDPRREARAACIDLFLLHEKRADLRSCPNALLIRKAEAQQITPALLESALRCEHAVLFLAQRMLKSKRQSVSACGQAVYEVLYAATTPARTGGCSSSTLVSSLTAPIGSGTQSEVQHSLDLELAVAHESIWQYQTPVMHMMDFVDMFSAAQIRRLYQIFAALSLSVDSDGELQIGNRLMRHWKCGVIASSGASTS